MNKTISIHIVGKIQGKINKKSVGRIFRIPANELYQKENIDYVELLSHPEAQTTNHGSYTYVSIDIRQKPEYNDLFEKFHEFSKYTY